MNALTSKLKKLWNDILDDPYFNATMHSYKSDHRFKNYIITLEDGRQFVGDYETWWCLPENKRAGFFTENALSNVWKNSLIALYDRENPPKFPSLLQSIGLGR